MELSVLERTLKRENIALDKVFFMSADKNGEYVIVRKGAVGKA
jgi:hypothetical protein